MIGADISLVKGIERRRVEQGLVFGKFMPPTNGHLYLVNFARSSCEKLTIVVCSLPTEAIPGKLRYQWMKEIFPDCNVVHLDEVMPQEPSHAEDKAFFQLWGDTLHKHCPGIKVDALFASEPYGYKMADIMKVRFIPVDAAREMVAISGTALRENPFLHWNRIHPVVRPYFLKRIALLGSNASEKNALIRKLAEHFDTSYAANYAETLVNDFSRNLPAYNATSLTLADISTIARGQMASEAALAQQAHKLLFVASELKSVAVLSEKMFGDCPGWVEEEAKKINYDLYLALDSDDSSWWKAASPFSGAKLVAVEGAGMDMKFQNIVRTLCALWPDLR